MLREPGPALQPGDVEGKAANQVGIVRLERGQEGAIEGGGLASFDDGAVPRAVADDATIDEPGIDSPAVRVDPDLAAAAKVSRSATAAAVEPGSRGSARSDRPLDAEVDWVLDTPACSSRWEARRERGQERGPRRARRGGDDREADEEAQAAVGGTRAVKQCQTGLEPPPRRTRAYRANGVAGASPHDGELLRPVFTWARGLDRFPLTPQWGVAKGLALTRRCPENGFALE